MNRQIKFRGKRTDGGGWVFGYYLQDLTNGEVRHYIFSCPSMIEVIPETVGQFTGLYDSTGKEIYEGDIFQKTAHPHIYRRITDSCGVCSGETFDVHPGVQIRYKVCFEGSGFDAQIIFVNPEGVKPGSTLIPQTAIEVGQRYSLYSFIRGENETITGNIHDKDIP